jgi:hypothetical protein
LVAISVTSFKKGRDHLFFQFLERNAYGGSRSADALRS